MIRGNDGVLVCNLDTEVFACNLGNDEVLVCSLGKDEALVCNLGNNVT